MVDAVLRRGLDEDFLGGPPPIRIEVEHGEALQAQVGRVFHEARRLVSLADRVAPHIVAALGEVRVRIRETELDEPRALVDRRRRHRRGAREVSCLDHDFPVADEFLRDRHRLARVGLAVLEIVGQGMHIGRSGLSGGR